MRMKLPKWSCWALVGIGLSGVAAQEMSGSSEGAPASTPAPPVAKIIDPLPLEPPAVPKVSVRVNNPIDAFIADKWRKFGVRPTRQADDLEFARRVHLDVIGRIPTLDELGQYNNTPAGLRDAKLVDRLLDSEEYADHWTIFWGDLLLERFRIDGAEDYAFRNYIHQVLKENQSYDRWVRDMIDARGMVRDDPAATFILRYDAQPDELTIAATQVFLGTQLKCAQCHDHPFEPWLQADFNGMKGFWSATRKRFGRVESVQRNGGEELVRYDQVVSGSDASGTFLTGAASPRGAGVDGLADLITARNNPYFARVAVNRIWAKLMGRGLVEPVDGFAVNNPPSHPELLDWLALEFISHDHDLKHIIRLICQSRTYRLSSVGPPTVANTAEGPFFERMTLKRMTAEQLHDSILVATNQGDGSGMERRAIEKRYPQPGGTFLSIFGCHDRTTLHERDDEATIPQALELLNGDFLNRAIQLHPRHPLRLWQAQGCDAATALKRLFVQLLAREPTRNELEVASRYIQQNGSAKGWTDIQWALINTREFMFIH